MKTEKQEEIFSKCPVIYRHRFADNQLGLRWLGFRCGDGWFELILELSLGIEKLINKQQVEHRLDENQLPYVVQVKEKFGGLNFYMSAQNDEISALIHNAAKRSEKICEQCGEPGKTRNLDGWCYTECVSCCRERLIKRGF
tara:strand:+ start:6079 stop:6501 length:423 start_codon:yes stop_codon:yes gene_type:complete